MKKTILLLSIFTIHSFVFSQKTEGTPMLGNDKDLHGCKPSTGYTFSHIKNKCIRLFDQKIQLTEQNSKAGWASNVAVVFSRNMKEAEIFVPESTSSILLKRYGKKLVWKRGSYELFVDNKKYFLKKENIITYKQ